MKKWMHKVALKIWAHYSTQSFLQWCLSCIKAMWEKLANICMCLWFYHLTGPIKTILVGHSESYVFVLPLFILFSFVIICNQNTRSNFLLLQFLETERFLKKSVNTEGCKLVIPLTFIMVPNFSSFGRSHQLKMFGKLLVIFPSV